ncbi:carbohydrate ABC transporter permease [Inquilinus sp. Marseille-Q2685]|uniref:carbohydrate ABC transporter permease n=1 Tax=Inquilinus sp. Marseille-Q2685 TaxID=2866581 RepID=UPI001CE43073|nr:carbohydrate ABC transporter permease [Inquilinus sp. Marseille-Q2685]
MTTRRKDTGPVTAGTLVSQGAMALVALAFLFPFFWMLTNAIRPNGEVLALPPRLLPSDWQWGNFLDAWVYLPFGRFFLNSALVSAAVTVIVLTVSSLAAYAFARLRFVGRDTLFLTYLSTLMIPQAVLVIPLFLLISRLDWVNTFQALILPVAFGSFGTFMLRQFFKTIPRELEEAALCDGASRLRILVSIILPMSLPVLGLLALFTFTAQWNSFLWPLIIVNGTDHATIPLGLTMFQTQQGAQWNYLMAGAAISMIPGLCLTILLQRYIFSGIAMNSGFGGR